MKAASVTVKSTAQFGFRLRDFLELAKPEVTSLIVLSTLAGFIWARAVSLTFPSCSTRCWEPPWWPAAQAL